MPFCSASFAGAAGQIVPQAGDDLVAGERGKGERLHEFAGRLGHHHMDFKGLALQRAHQLRRLVRGNSARDAHRDSHGSIVEQIQWTVDRDRRSGTSRDRLGCSSQAVRADCAVPDLPQRDTVAAHGNAAPLVTAGYAALLVRARKE